MLFERVHDLQAQSNSSPGAYDQHPGSPSRLLAPHSPVLVLGLALTPAFRVRLSGRVGGRLLGVGQSGAVLAAATACALGASHGPSNLEDGSSDADSCSSATDSTSPGTGVFEIQRMFSAHPAGRQACFPRVVRSKRWPERQGRCRTGSTHPSLSPSPQWLTGPCADGVRTQRFRIQLRGVCAYLWRSRRARWPSAHSASFHPLRGSFPQRVHVRHRVPVTCGGNQARYGVQRQLLRRRGRCT
ncbi:unnamed protein product [Peronospora belbahrii]|uniref:Uncharacterized protein n=1 Tax=Peronospora belbahrii TaxID=622444 RepID=A0ABN8D0W4_9STRA|nr:unnamed protein product [Peronospora belbahrii]CAH0518747.1 unnamed protein product [Peronospora belbahrii]